MSISDLQGHLVRVRDLADRIATEAEAAASQQHEPYNAEALRATFTEKARPWARLGVLVAVASLAVAFVNVVDGVVQRFHAGIAGNAECCKSFEAYRDEDSNQRNFWVNVIEELRGEVANIGTTLFELRTEIAIAQTKIETLERTGSIPDDSELEAALKDIRETLQKLQNDAINE